MPERWGVTLFLDTQKSPAFRKLNEFESKFDKLSIKSMPFSYSDDVCVLSAIGTAAVINHQFVTSEAHKSQTVALIPSSTPKDTDRDVMKDMKNMTLNAQKINENDARNSDADFCSQIPTGCTLCHIPHSKLPLPVNGKMKKCAVCK